MNAFTFVDASEGTMGPMTVAESVQVSFPRPVLRPRPADVEVLSARIGRVAFGAILSAGALSMFAVPVALGDGGRQTLELIVASWPLALLARALITFFGPVFVKRALPAQDRWLRASLALPAVGYALLLPLSLHAVVGVFMADAFDKWVLLSGVIVGHVHLTLALLAVRRALRLVDGDKALSPLKIYGIVVLISCVPGIVLLGIPPALVALTGWPFIFILARFEDIIAGERRRLAEGAVR